MNLSKKINNAVFHPSPREKIRWIFLGILVLFFLTFNLNYPTFYNKFAGFMRESLGINFSDYWEKPFRLGLDLQGGTHLVYDADVSQLQENDRLEAVEGVRNVIEKRVNNFGVSEPLVQTNVTGNNYRVIVDLAGIKDIHQAIDMIGKTPLLEFKEENNDPPRDLTDEEKKDMDNYNKEAKKRIEEILKEVKGGKSSFADLADKYTEDMSNLDESGNKKGGELGYLGAFGLYSDIYEAAKENVDKYEKEQTKIKNNQPEKNKTKKDGLGAFSLEGNLSEGNGQDGNLDKLNISVNKVFENQVGYNILRIEDKRQGEEKEIRARHILICWKGAERCEKDWSKEEAKKKIDEIKTKINNDNFAQLAQENSTEPGAKESGGSLGWFKKDQMVPEFAKAVSEMKVGSISDVVETPFGYHLIFKAEERPVVEYKIRRIFLRKKNLYDYVPPSGGWKNTGLTGEQLKKAEAQFDQNTGDPEISLEFNDDGKKLFAEITTRNVNKPVAIFLDGVPLSTPRVSEPIREGRAVINGKFNIKEAKDLARDLNAGALPVPIKLVNQQNIGATLGTETVQSGIKAGVWGLILVMIYMLIVYKFPGLLSDLALLVYASLNLAIYKLWPITLTLAGLAGLILSFGMGVDASVLIFERMNEELNKGKPLNTAIKEGFSKAWPSIRDGNISTLITCAILIKFGSSMIRGFAITLSIGVLISIFTNLFVMRNFMEIVSGWGWFKDNAGVFSKKLRRNGRKEEEKIAERGI